MLPPAFMSWQVPALIKSYQKASAGASFLTFHLFRAFAASET